LYYEPEGDGIRSKYVAIIKYIIYSSCVERYLIPSLLPSIKFDDE